MNRQSAAPLVCGICQQPPRDPRAARRLTVYLEPGQTGRSVVADVCETCQRNLLKACLETLDPSSLAGAHVANLLGYIVDNVWSREARANFAGIVMNAEALVAEAQAQAARQVAEVEQPAEEPPPPTRARRRKAEPVAASG